MQPTEQHRNGVALSYHETRGECTHTHGRSIRVPSVNPEDRLGFLVRPQHAAALGDGGAASCSGGAWSVWPCHVSLTIDLEWWFVSFIEKDLNPSLFFFILNESMPLPSVLWQTKDCGEEKACDVYGT
jgi:hypothetical protein